MVTVILRGGLGNQMFQYAAGLNLARKYDVPLVLDTTILNDRLPRKGITFRDYDLDVFDIHPRFTKLSRISKNVPIPGAWVVVDMAVLKIKDVCHISKFVSEKHAYGFDPTVLEAGGNLSLFGLWQSEKYFLSNADEIRRTFDFKQPLSGSAVELAKSIRDRNSISLSVRRGDYTKPINAKIFGEMDASYYDRAIAYMVERVKNPHFFIFSDDIAWCREHIKPPFPTTYLDETTQGPKSSFHLQLISLCKNNIITNSSFAWWGAWLNQNPDKIIIAPKVWAKTEPAESAAVPEGWVRI